MPLIHHRHDKDELIDLLRKLIAATIFHGISEAKRTQIMSVIEWMKSQPGAMNADARFETDQGRVKFTVEMDFQGGKKS